MSSILNALPNPMFEADERENQMHCVNPAKFVDEENSAPKTDLEAGAQSNLYLSLSLWQLSAVSEVSGMHTAEDSLGLCSPRGTHAPDRLLTKPHAWPCVLSTAGLSRLLV